MRVIGGNYWGSSSCVGVGPLAASAPAIALGDGLSFKNGGELAVVPSSVNRLKCCKEEAIYA